MSSAPDVLPVADRQVILHPAHSRRERLCSVAEILRVVSAVLDEMRSAGYHDRDMFSVRLGLEEALCNAIKHGHRHDPSKEVRVTFAVSPEQVLAEVEDQGPGFNPEQLPDPLADENLERPCGRGVLLMRSYMTWIRFNPQGNAVTLCRRRSG